MRCGEAMPDTVLALDGGELGLAYDQQAIDWVVVMPQTAPLPAARLVNRTLVGTPLLGAKPQQYASPSARRPQVPLLAVSDVNVPGTFVTAIGVLAQFTSRVV